MDRVRVSLPCPNCGGTMKNRSSRTETVDKRGPIVRRYKKCDDCGETAVSVEAWVPKQTRWRHPEPWYMEDAFK